MDTFKLQTTMGIFSHRDSRLIMAHDLISKLIKIDIARIQKGAIKNVLADYFHTK
jgi:hypothetical protein